MLEIKLSAIESLTSWTEWNIEIDWRENSTNHLSLKAIETNGWRKVRMRPREGGEFMKQCFIGCAIDSHRCSIAYSEQSEAECTSSKKRAIPEHAEQSKEKMMNIEKEHFNRFQFHSKRNGRCWKRCKIRQNSRIREQSQPTYKEILAKMIFREQRWNQKNHQRRFIKRITIEWQKRLLTASNQSEILSTIKCSRLRVEILRKFEPYIITTSKLNDESACQQLLLPQVIEQ